MLKSIITNKISAKKYQDEGFCYFGDFSIETFSKLKQLYVMNFNPDETIGLYPTHYNGIKEKNIFISNEIYSICRQELDNLFSDYKHLISHFVIKQKQFTSFFDLHQDWSIVEENEFEVVHLWIPLQDTHVNNGGLFIVPKSHKLFNNYRSGSLGIPFIQYSNKLEDYVNHLNLKSGQIFAYHPALFHGSSPNNSDSDRIAIIITLRHVDSELLYFHNNGRGELEKYVIPEETLLSELKILNNLKSPEFGKLKETLLLKNFDNKKINTELLINQLKQSTI